MSLRNIVHNESNSKYLKFNKKISNSTQTNPTQLIYKFYFLVYLWGVPLSQRDKCLWLKGRQDNDYVKVFPKKLV